MEMEERKKVFDSCLLNKDYEALKFFALKFDSIPNILCSG